MIPELLAIFGTSFLIGLSGALMPGPLVTLAIAESARWGFTRGPAVVLGHAVVELAAVVGLLFGLSQLVQNEGVAGAIGTAGGLVLLWMGFGLGRGAWRGEMVLTLGDNAAELSPATVAATAVAGDRLAGSSLPDGGWVPRRLLASPVLRGSVASIANPYWLLWWATVGAAYVGRSLTLGAPGLAAFYVGHVLSDLGWISLVALVVASGRRALSQRVYRGLILFCAGVLTLLGGYFLWFGTSQLLQAFGF